MKEISCTEALAMTTAISILQRRGQMCEFVVRDYRSRKTQRECVCERERERVVSGPKELSFRSEKVAVWCSDGWRERELEMADRRA